MLVCLSMSGRKKEESIYGNASRKIESTGAILERETHVFRRQQLPENIHFISGRMGFYVNVFFEYCVMDWVRK